MEITHLNKKPVRLIISTMTSYKTSCHEPQNDQKLVVTMQVWILKLSKTLEMLLP